MLSAENHHNKRQQMRKNLHTIEMKEEKNTTNASGDDFTKSTHVHEDNNWNEMNTKTIITLTSVLFSFSVEY